MQLAWYIITSLIIATDFFKDTFTKDSERFNPSECKALYGIRGKPKTEAGITTYYFGRRCRDFLQNVADENMYNLPEAPRDIHVSISCDNRSADIVWVQRVDDDTVRNMAGFLLQAHLVNRQDLNSTFLCFGIFIDETISSLLLNKSLDAHEFEFSCFESAPNATLEASIWSISSQDRNACQSLINCSYMVDKYSEAPLDMRPIDEEKSCPEDCNCWKPDWSLMIVINESAPCPSLQLLLDNVSSSLASLHIFIVHNETGNVAMDTSLEHKMFETSKNLILNTGHLQKGGIYYAKLETVCEVQRPSTCQGITKFISDYVSVSCDDPPVKVQEVEPSSKHKTDILVAFLIVSSFVVFIFISAFFIFMRVQRHVGTKLPASVPLNNRLDLVQMEMLSPFPIGSESDQTEEKTNSEEVQLLPHSERKVTLLCHQDHLDPLQRDALQLLLSLLLSLGLIIHDYDNSKIFSNWLTYTDMACNNDVTDFIVMAAPIDNGKNENGGDWNYSPFQLFENAVMANLRTRYAEKIKFYVHILSFDVLESQLISDFIEKHNSCLKISRNGHIEKNTFIYCLSKHSQNSEDILSNVLHLDALHFLLVRILKRSLEDIETYITSDAKLHLQRLQNFFKSDFQGHESKL